MRKITTETERVKKETRSKIIIGVVLVALMVLSTAGYSFFSGSGEEREKIEYNGLEFFLNENNLWNFKIQNLDFSTQYNPEETLNISTPFFMTINDYIGKALYFSGENTGAKQEIARNLLNLVSRTQEVCVESLECVNKDLPIKNCSRDNIIITRELDTIEVYQEDKCIFLSSPYDEQERVADAFLFRILGVRNL